jgi:hypothetical protein
MSVTVNYNRIYTPCVYQCIYKMSLLASPSLRGRKPLYHINEHLSSAIMAWLTATERDRYEVGRST